MATIPTNIRLDSETKKEANIILHGLGMTISDAVNIFLCQVAINKGLPFDVKITASNHPDKKYAS